MKNDAQQNGERPSAGDDRLLRAPPSFAVYASDDLASSRYFGLSVGERGLLASMERAYWAEQAHGLPAQPVLLARVCRLDVAEVEHYLTPGVLAHFERDEGDPSVLHSTELRRQFRVIRAAREKMSMGGQIGASMTNAKRGARRKPKRDKTSDQSSRYPASHPAPHPSGSGRGPERNEMKERASLDRDASQPLHPEIEQWRSDYEKAETEQCTAERYRSRKE